MPADLAPRTVLIPEGHLALPGHPGGNVRIASFWFGRTPVTNREYAAFLTGGSACEPPWWSDPRFRSPLQPVVGITWDEAVAYCEWLSRAVGGSWRLPEEAEWEHAVRGGLACRPTAWGDAVPFGEVPEGALSGPWEVGRGTPNGYGVLDPGTIVHEWCRNWHEPGTSDRPQGQARLRRASRGGSWRHRIRWSSPGARSSLPPAYRYADYGFRVLREDGS